MAYLRMANIPPTEQALAEARRELGLDRRSRSSTLRGLRRPSGCLGDVSRCPLTTFLPR